MSQTTPMENYNKVIAKAWTDKNFKSKLMKDPKAALHELGIEVPAGVNIKVVEDDAKTATLVLPAPPKEGDLSVEDLNAMSGGTAASVCLVCIFCA